MKVDKGHNILQAQIQKCLTGPYVCADIDTMSCVCFVCLFLGSLEVNKQKNGLVKTASKEPTDTGLYSNYLSVRMY